MIVVSLTSWKKRINVVGKMLFHFFKNQTVKPDKIVLTLASDEFQNKEKDLPEDLKLILKYLNVELNWVNKNIYGHKKYEVFRKYNKETVILVDDDILYESDYIEKLISYSVKYPSCVSCYYSSIMDYNDGEKKYGGFTGEPSYKTTLLSGLSCFPPNVFPMDSFKYANDRDNITPRCDDSWVNGWLVKNRIKIVSIKDYRKASLKCFNNTQNVGIWRTYNSKNVNHVNQKYINFSKVLQFLKCNNIVHDLWPKMNIERISKL